MDVLLRAMLRTSKAHVQAGLLPPLSKFTVRLPFDREHEESYNVLIDVRLCFPPAA
jgi:hypothetical protein